MKAILWGCLFILVTLSADVLPIKEYPGLFANVQDVVNNDVLNVREAPSYKSKKVSSYSSDGFMMVDYCQKNGRSTWCNVYPAPLLDEGGKGWVNARFLKFKDNGYVSILNRKSICNYSLKCENKEGVKKCLVVTDIGSYENIQLKSEWVDREQLKPETNFSAADDLELNPEGGYCTQGRMIEDYLREHPETYKR